MGCDGLPPTHEQHPRTCDQPQQNRPDLAKTETEEIAVIEKYLPEQLSEDEIREELKKIIAQTGATSASEMGKVMGVASKQFAGRADNKLVSQLVKQLLG